MPNAIYDQIKSLVVIKDDPNFATYDNVKKTLVVSHQLTGALLKVWDGLRGTPVNQDELAEAAEFFYRDYIEPIDLPINDLVERYVDASVLGFIRPGVKALDTLIDKRLG